MENSFENFDGVIKYEAALGMTPIRNNHFDEDNFYEMNGECNCGHCPLCEEKSNALGGLIPSRAQRQQNRAKRQTRKDNKSKAKLTQAQASKIAAQSMGRDSQSDIALAKAFATPVSGKRPPQSVGGGGLSSGAKIGIAIGSVALLGIIGYLIYTKVSKKGK